MTDRACFQIVYMYNHATITGLAGLQLSCMTQQAWDKVQKRCSGNF